MRKVFLVALLLCSLSAVAQSVKDEIKKNIAASASNYRAYPGPTQAKLTPAPKGKKPFYISHYGRHGSRYLISRQEYYYAFHTLTKAHQLGKLSELGEDVLHRVQLLKEESEGRLGDLTALGAQQHKDIARRMYERFPDVFADDCHIDARSTVVLRCVLSMENALQQLLLKNPRLSISHDASYHDMYYMNQQDRKLTALPQQARSREAFLDYCKKRPTWQRMVPLLFNDTAYVNHDINGERLNQHLFKLASIVQNSDLRKRVTLYDLFTDDEIYTNWQKENVYWFLSYGQTTLNGGQLPFIQRNLLRRMIAEADSCLRLPHPSASLRYGHETIVLPLTCLLGINGYDQNISDLEQLEKKGWANYRIFPMASNIQIVFYRDSPADADILLKVLLNENEATLPLKTDCAPYYHWTDFRDYYTKKLDSYKE